MKATYPEWVSSDYAASIPADAKGTDSKTGNPYIDEWMPDKNLQQLILKQYKNSTNPVSSPDQITKDWLKNNVLSMNASFITQRTDKSYYENTVNMQSLEGLQYATELRMIYTTPDFNASENWGITSIGKLSDLEALRSLTKFKAIDAEMDSIYDISPLSDKSLVNNITEVINGVQLIYSTQLQQNHIIDASPLKLSIPTSESNTYQFGNQIYIAPEITINPNTTSNYMQSKYIKGVDGANVPVKYYPVASTDPDSWMNNRGLGIDYKSTADEDSATTTTTKVAWTNLKKNYDSTNNLGYMTVIWNKTLPNQTSYSYQGWYIQPYRLDDNYHDKTTITVHYQDKNGNQIKPDDEQSGALHDSYSAPSHDNIKFNNHEYRWIKTEGTIPSQFTDSNQEFTYVYGQLAKPVTVHYVDAATQQTIAPDKTFPLKTDKNYPGIVDDPYDVSKDYKININGYTYKDVKAGSDPVTGTLGETGKTVTYEYTKNSNPTPPNPGPGLNQNRRRNQHRLQRRRHQRQRLPCSLQLQALPRRVKLFTL